MIFFERPFVKVRWNDEFQYVEIAWTGFAYGNAYREAVNAALELHRIKGCSRNIADLRKAGVMVEEDARWVLSDWLPRAAAAGVRRIAIVSPGSATATIQLEQLRHRKGGKAFAEKNGLETMYFPDLDDARRWVLRP